MPSSVLEFAREKGPNRSWFPNACCGSTRFHWSAARMIKRETMP